MYDDKTERTARLLDFARSHPTRANILALVEQGEGRSLDPGDLARELPNKPAPAVVTYHLKVLRSASLLPTEESGASAA
jgi:DNA-binding transcriptional ArsR family regulator